MDRENYFILLELPLDPPSADPGLIKAAIARKRQEWTRLQDHPGRRAQALAHLEALPDIERVLLTPALRETEAEAAAVLRADKLRQFEAELRILEGKGHLMHREVSAIIQKYKVYGVDRLYLESVAVCPISDDPPPAPKTEPTGEVLDRMSARTIARNLELLGHADLYEFLGEPPYSSIKKLQTAAEQQRRAAASSGSKNAQATAAGELAGLCMRLFEDFDAKQKYDRLLKVSQYPSVGELIDEEFTRAKYISSEALLRLINYAVETYQIRVLVAEEFIRRYCDAYHIPLGGEKPLIDCPHCGTSCERDGVVCTSCGQPLHGNCPQCGAEFHGGPAVCGSCGFSIKDMAKALPYIDAAHEALIDNNWSTAQRNLQHAAKHWPGHAQLDPLGKRARNLEQRYARYMEDIADCVAHNQYYAALELIREAQARGIKLPSKAVTPVEKTIEKLEKQIQALTLGGDEPDIERVLELSGTVADSIELDRLLSQQPPREPESLKASVVKGRQVRLNWPASESTGRVEYVLVRKAFGAPLTAYDGDILYEGPANSFTDLRPQGLQDYYYRVFSRRGGVYSPEGTTTGPVLIIPEIDNLKILPGDMSAQLSWTPSEDIREVLIWRKLGGEKPTAPGDGIKLETTRIDGYNDTKIKNDVEYWYYVVAVYVVDGQKVYSRGVCECITPHRMYAPVESLQIVKADGDEDEYVVNWSATDFGNNLLLFSTPKKPEFQRGEVFEVQQLHRDYRNLELHVRHADSGRFHLSFTGGVYVFAAVLFGKFAAVGGVTYLTNVHDIEAPTWDLIDGELYLNMKWPQGLGEIVLAHRFDHFPTAPDEPGTTLVPVTREQYDYDAAVLLREPQPRDYYVKIYGAFTAPDGTRTLSPGVDMKVANAPLQEVLYRFSYKRRFFSRTGTISLTFTSDKPFLLPKCVLLGKIGRLPLHAADGNVLFEVEKDTRVEGEITFHVQASKLPSDLYVRVFLRDNAQYEKLRLLPANNLKVT